MTTAISLKTNPESTFAMQRRTTSKADVFDNIPAGLAAVIGALQGVGLAPAGPPTTVFHVVPESGIDGEIALCVPVDGALPVGDSGALDNDGVEITTLPEQTVASLVHEGSYETLGDTYAAIAAWVQDHGHTISGPPSETYFNSPGEVADIDLRTEVAFPIAAVA